MVEQIITGAIQGIAEWLPVSSEGLIVLIKTNLFAHGASIEEIIKNALFLHLGTFFAALFYFRKDVKKLSKAVLHYKSSHDETKNILKFLIIATLVSGIVGIILLKTIIFAAARIELSGKLITVIIGLLLLISGILEIRAKNSGHRNESNLGIADSILLGFVQGLAVLPGLSRSGLTVSTFLLRKYDKTLSLKLSFLMSLPIVLGGNILFNAKHLAFYPEELWGLLMAFIFGMLTIHLLLMLSKKINFGYFVLFFAAVTFISALF